jgi:hypothetical protein
MLRLEHSKREWFIKQGVDNAEDLNFFRSIVAYMELPPTKKKVVFEVTVPKYEGTCD